MYPKFQIALVTLFISLSFNAFAQGNFDLIAIDGKKSSGKLVLDYNSIKLITDRPLYDNQPAFINDIQMAFSAVDEKGNNDIIIYNFEKDKFTNLTKTADRNEFSPSLTDCGLYVSAVTVEPDGKQRLWLYPTNFGEPELLYDDIEPVGYYDWYDNKAAMFVLGQPNKLVYPYSKSELHTISENVGRSVKKKPKTSIITYIDKNVSKDVDGMKSYAIKGFDIEKRTYFDYGYTFPGSEDFIWLDNQLLLMGKGNDLYVRKAEKTDWEKAGSIILEGYQNITRMAYSADLKKLVVVMERK
ncbi:hypothetical protein [Aquiflexum gelatinilyticum]|uniref:Uncharacterized protein n=1 Tax=Aquiflexum gelatinilyticum TaxID=2961943 RepID=A0A9X2T0V0_9BACT|nr:hypothetical protein [Aquiflexum gelatinilyticum]MCR9015231.1 hypothetical protein [Aquiflexum gelatinilyticum]